MYGQKVTCSPEAYQGVVENGGRFACKISICMIMRNGLLPGELASLKKGWKIKEVEERKRRREEKKIICKL